MDLKFKLTIDFGGKVRFYLGSDLKTGNVVRVMWNTFHPYGIKDHIEVDMTFIRSTDDNLKILKCLIAIVDDDMLF